MENTETKVSHTPGPWNATTNDHSNDAYYGFKQIISENGWYICDVAGNAGLSALPTTEAEANAKLIASAPELLEALKGLTAYFKYMVKDPHFKEYVDAVNAIKKATE